MPKHVLFSVRDVVSNVYGRPFTATNEASAVRSIRQEVANPQPGNMLATNPDDFELYTLGVFDDETCVIETHQAPVLVVRVSALKEAA